MMIDLWYELFPDEYIAVEFIVEASKQLQSSVYDVLLEGVSNDVCADHSASGCLPHDPRAEGVERRLSAFINVHVFFLVDAFGLLELCQQGFIDL
jgi:hypothetical protein